MGFKRRTQDEIVQLYGELINPSKARIMGDVGLGRVEEKREGIYVWDRDGLQFIDLRDDAGVYNLGRRPPKVIKKLKEALDSFDLGNNLFFSEPRVDLAEKLISLSPRGELKGVTYGVSGGEIVDFALKMARAYTGRRKIIAFNNGFYGCTGLAVTATSGSTYHKPCEPLIPEVVHVPFNDLRVLNRKMDHDTACVIVEVVQGHGGVNLPEEGYLQGVRELCDKYGALMIVDEIQTGFGRTGKFFACEHYDVCPDILTVGKAMSGGVFPITAALFRQEYLKFWDDYPFSHLSTFGGSDLGCVVALETIKIIQEEKLMDRALHLEKIFVNGFAELREKYPNMIKEFRHKGLLMAIEFYDKQDGPEMSRHLSEVGVLADYIQTTPQIMRLLPPLIMTDEEAKILLKAYDYALYEVQSERPAYKNMLYDVTSSVNGLF